MSFAIIKKDNINYINSNVFINHLNIPLYETLVKSDSKTLNSLKLIIEKLDVLLKIPHREFWCHIIFDCSVLNSIQSYFNNVNRPYDVALKNFTRHKLEIEVYKKYYLVILRIISKKENLSVFSNFNFGSLIYDNFVIDIPFIFDLCSIYGDGNSEMISKIIMFIFTCQPLYFDDFRSYAQESMKFLEEKISNLSKNSNNVMDRNNLMIKNYHSAEQKSEELLYYIIDLCYSWNTFLDAVETKTEIYTILFDISFHKLLEKSFQKYVPIIQSNIDKFETTDPENLKKLLSVSCYYLISVWRKIFSVKFLGGFQEKSSILNVRSSEENFELINNCLSIINSCQEYPIFADAMYLMFPIYQDFEVILQSVKSDRDQYYEDFVKDSLKEIKREIDSRQTMFSSKPLIENDLSANREINTEKENESVDMGILQITEIYPSLSVKDINIYMKNYACSSEDMLDALLAEAITVDFVKNTCNANSKLEEFTNYPAILNNHLSIYDGDALDTGKLTASQIHIGKKQREFSQTVDPLLRQMILNIIVQQDEEEETSQIRQTPLNANLIYDDEFDDVYGITHSGVVVDNRVEESNYESDKINQSVSKTTRGKDDMKGVNFESRTMKKTDCFINKNDTLNKNDSKIEDNKGSVMEPSNLKYSSYDKRQFKKKKYQENKQKVTNGENFSHRLGSHGPKANTYNTNNHRSKADKYES